MKLWLAHVTNIDVDTDLDNGVSREEQLTIPLVLINGKVKNIENAILRMLY